MNASKRFSAAAIGSAAISIAACGLVIDPDRLVAGDFGAASVEAGADGSVPVTDPNCRATGPEVCDDGVDNDCNGLADCADPECGEGFVCVDPPPEGWETILLADHARPPCPPPYSDPTDVRVIEGDGALTCSCDCGNNCGSAIVLGRSSSPGCASGVSFFDADATNCTSKSFDLASGFAMATSEGDACAASDTVVAKNDPTGGRTCAPPRKVGIGCSGAQRCLPRANAFATCIAKVGTNACPTSAFTKRWRSGTSSNDERECAGCSCDSNPCTVELQLWTHPTCQGGSSLTISDSCAANGAISNIKAYKSTTASGCTQATPSVQQGTLSFENERTICCP